MSSGRMRLSAEQIGALWRRRQAGESLTSIGHLLGVSLSSLFGVVARAGGLPPRPRMRRASALRVAEREEISRGLAAGESARAMARALGRAPSTVTREITRHGGRSRYRAAQAETEADAAARRPKRARLVEHVRLQRIVAAKLRQRWAPQQIAGWLMSTYPDDPALHVSHETIYRTLYIQARGALKKELVEHLRRHRVLRRPRAATGTSQGRGQIVDAVSIAERPPSAEDRALPGHWEGDLLAGGRHSYIATLVERRSRYVILLRVRGKDTTSVVSALIRRVQHLPVGLMASLTWDRGTELAQHQRFTVATNVQVYFCDPQSPWQRGSNENTNGLLRQYFPHGTDLTQFSQARLETVARQLNMRPRQTLGWRNPAQVLYESVAMTG